MTLDLERLRAYRGTAAGITAIVLELSPGRARAVAHRSANGAGFHVAFTDVHVARCPELDVARDAVEPSRAWDERHVRRALAEARERRHAPR